MPPSSWVEAAALPLPPSASDRGCPVARLLKLGTELFRTRCSGLRKPIPSLRIWSVIRRESPLGPSAP